MYSRIMDFLYSCTRITVHPLPAHPLSGTDNGFAVWLMELGIQPVYSDPASPQQNGRHERMHRGIESIGL